MKLGIDSRKRTDRHLRKEHFSELYECCDMALKNYQKEVAAQIDARAKLNATKANGVDRIMRVASMGLGS